MRNISTIEVSELKNLWRLVMPEIEKKYAENAQAYKYRADEESPERVVLMSGICRLGIYFSQPPHIWADCDFEALTLDENVISEFLRANNFSN